MTACACHRSFGPLIFSNRNSFDGPKLKIRKVDDHVTSDYFEFASLVNQNYSNWRKLVDQNCDGMHMPSRDYLL